MLHRLRHLFDYLFRRRRFEQVRPGFEPRHLLTFQLPVGYSPEERRAIMEREAEFASVPGVERVGANSHLPLDQDLPNWYGPYRPQGFSPQQADATAADFRSITPGYFATIGARLIEGRYFDGQDRIKGRQVTIIDEIVARSAWHGESPIGKTIEMQGDSRVVVGMVEHAKNHSLTEDVEPLVPAVRAKLNAQDLLRLVLWPDRFRYRIWCGGCAAGRPLAGHAVLWRVGARPVELWSCPAAAARRRAAGSRPGAPPWPTRRI